MSHSCLCLTIWTGVCDSFDMPGACQLRRRLVGECLTDLKLVMQNVVGPPAVSHKVGAREGFGAWAENLKRVQQRPRAAGSARKHNLKYVAAANGCEIQFSIVTGCCPCDVLPVPCQQSCSCLPVQRFVESRASEPQTQPSTI